MKKNKMMRLASCLLVMVLLTTSMISGTFAKYTTSTSAEDSARVALWDIKVNGTEITVENPTVTLDIFNTVTDTDFGTEEDIETTDGSIIAPGTSGEFKFKIKNDSEVTAQYKVEYSVVNTNNIPIEYSLDKTTWSTDIGTINSAFTSIAMGAEVETAPIYWRWAFTGNGDDADTKLGIAGTAEVEVTATITVEQVD